VWPWRWPRDRLVANTADANHMRVVRAEKALEKAHLIKRDRDGWELTESGKREVARL
jgi:hypothetical protein